MIAICQSGDEVELSGSTGDLQRIRAEIITLLSSENQDTSIRAAASDPAPYERCLSELTVRRADGKTLALVVGDALVVQGQDDSLARFSTWFNAPSTASPKWHSHFEPLPEDPWHSSDSVALVIAVA
jgi:hypothetical protein